MTPTDHTAQWLVALIDRLDLLAAAIALFVIIRAIQPLFSGLRKFWEYYAANSGRAWIDEQRDWLNDVKSKFALTTWWCHATGNITSALDRVYGFETPESKLEKYKIWMRQMLGEQTEDDVSSENTVSNSKPPSKPTTNNGSFIDQMFSSWRQFLQRQAFTRALLIAYIYFYGFCLLLAFNNLPEATSWQLLILLAANLALLVGITKWRIEKTDAFTIALTVAGAFAAAFVFAVVDAIALAVAGAEAFAIVFAGAFALALALAPARFSFRSRSRSRFRNFYLAIVSSSARHFTIATAFALAFIGVLNVANRLLSLVSPAAPLPASPLELLSAQAETLTSYPNFYLAAFTLLFLVFPWVNAALDWLSVSASRAAFYLLHRDLSAEQREDRAYGKAFLHLALDLALALAFKLTVLLLLYIYARLYGEFGVSFSVETVKCYWALLNPLDSVAFEWKKLWDTNDHKFITLMISTTLLPTLLHFGWVLLYVLCRSLWTLLRLLFAFAVSEAATFAATISVLITVAALTALTMAIDPSDDNKNKENNTTNATQTSELLIPLPHL